MKATIITAALAAFAAAATEQIKAADQGCVLADLSVTPDGSITGLLSVNPGTSPSSPGSIHSVEVLSGGKKKVQEALDKILAEDPYSKPLKLAVMEVHEPLEAVETQKPAEPKGNDKDKGKPKAEAVVIAAKECKTRKVYVLIVGKFQP
jgi:hypothetical protein